jgi:transmembrane sensor
MKFNHDEISQLVYERFAGTISEEDNIYLDQVLETDLEYSALYKEISDKLEDRNVKSVIQHINEQAAWEQVRTNFAETPKRTLTRKTLAKRSLAYAATILIVLSTGGYFFYGKSGRTLKSAAKFPQQIQLQLASGEKVNIDDSASKVIYAGNVKLNTGIKELSFRSSSSKSTGLNTLIIPKTLTYRVILSDGTAILLNSSSKLRFPINFKGPSREVYLEGEGYFEVAKNPKMPFIVHTALTDIKVLGTTFNVSAYRPTAVTTSLLEGSVVTNAKNKKELRLKPGMQAVYSPRDGFTENRFETEEVVSWIDGIYNFHDAPLQEIAPIVERWFDMNVSFASDTVADLKFTGTIDKNQPLEVFLHNLEASANINSSVEKGNISFSRQ